MIAIDLIDLSDPLLKDRSQSIRFISHPGDSPQIDFWQLWTAKEAAFKAQRISQPFRPKEIAIQFNSVNTFQYGDYSGNTYKSSEWVISTLSDKKIDFVVFEAETSDPSKEIRDKISTWFAEKQHVDTSVSIDQTGLPMLQHNQSPISITHHGRFMAFAYFPQQ